MAHEFAHILQYNHPEIKWKNTLQQEVHADFLAGWYIQKYINEKLPKGNPWDYAYNQKISNIETDIKIKFGWLGDTEYGSPQHHGNYTVRCSAVHYGMDYFSRGYKDLDEVFVYGQQEADVIIDKYDTD